MRTRTNALFALASLVLALGLGGCPTLPAPTDAGVVPYDYVTGNRYDGPISFSDSRVQGVDLSRMPSTPTPCHAPAIGVVNRIVDGDTIHVVVPADGAEYDVRLIGVNAPEIAHSYDGSPPTMADCYGDEAWAFTELLRGHTVILTFDTDCNDSTESMRLLAYVWIGSGPGDLWQRQLLERGFARILSIEPDTSLATELQTHEDAARAAGRGLWSACP